MIIVVVIIVVVVHDYVLLAVVLVVVDLMPSVMVKEDFGAFGAAFGLVFGYARVLESGFS